MRIPLDYQSKLPLYRQIENYLRESILSGRLPAETRLPATHQLARQPGISRITVTQAYRALENDGLIASREGRIACIRLNFATQAPENIHEGIRRLGVALKKLSPLPD